MVLLHVEGFIRMQLTFRIAVVNNLKCLEIQ